MMTRKLLVGLAFTFIANACSDPKRSSNDSRLDIRKSSKEFGLNIEDVYLLHSAYLPHLFLMHDRFDSSTIKNHYQPMQALYFNRAGKLLSFHVNCYAGPDPPLNWNKNKVFEQFVPATIAPIDSVFGFSELLSFIRTIEYKSVDIDSFSSFYYLVVVFWTSLMHSQDSRNLVKTVQQNLLKSRNTRVLYVNVNDMYIWQNPL